MIAPRLRKAAIIAGGIVVVGAAAVVFLGSRSTIEERSIHEVCRVCGTYRVTSTRTVDGVKGGATVEVHTTATATDLLPGDHQHDFAFDFVNTNTSTPSPWPWRRGGSFAHGDGFPGYSGRMPNKLTMEYNTDPSFRKLVAERMGSGDISKELAQGIVLLLDLDGPSEAASKARELWLEFSR